jgi:ATP-dependent RNA helicase RhlE
MKFEAYNIHPAIKRSLEERGFKRPTDIQHRAITPILAGEDVLAIAQTGTGKTAAFAIPVLHLITEIKRNSRNKGIKCLVMVPTRELSIQIAEVFEQLARFTEISVMSLVGGVDQAPQIAKLNQGVDVLISTPGRMFDLIYQGHIKITKTEILVLDEADHMLDLGFNKDIHDVIKFLPKRHQTLFFSATISPVIKDLAYELVNKPIRIQISPKDPISKNVDHSVAFIEMDDKRFFLERMIKENPDSRILVFVRTKVRCERVHLAMERVGIKTVTMHGGKEQEDRLTAMAAFKEGTVNILIATDISARGIDIANVEYVVNYDLPDVSENYVHRVGRTGRGVSRGFAVTFCSPEEEPILREIEEFVGKPVKVIEMDKGEYKDTLVFTQEVKENWRALLKEADQQQQAIKDKGLKWKKAKKK